MLLVKRQEEELEVPEMKMLRICLGVIGMDGIRKSDINQKILITNLLDIHEQLIGYQFETCQAPKTFHTPISCQSDTHKTSVGHQ